jgi:signal transduction histidine kinase
MLPSMIARSPSLEQNLLHLSGVAAIAVVAVVNCSQGPQWVNLAVHVAFGVIFLLGAYDDSLGLPRVAGRSCVLAMFVLSIVALYLNPDTVTLILAVVLMASAPYHLGSRWCWLLMAAANLCYWLILQGWSQVAGFETAFITLLALQGFAITSSLSREREVETRELLARQNNELLAARAVLAVQNKVEERSRIAGDLHDTIGHRLTGLRLQLEALGHRVPDALKSDVTRCQALTADILEDIRSIVRRMSEDQRGGLAASIEQIAALTPGVDLVIDGTLPVFPAALSQQLVFCVQEAVNNAIRHGGATRISIRWDGNALRIEDNGRGLGGRHPVPGFGLAHIDQRLASFGGGGSLSPAGNGRGSILSLSVPAGLEQ